MPGGRHVLLGLMQESITICLHLHEEVDKGGHGADRDRLGRIGLLGLSHRGQGRIDLDRHVLLLAHLKWLIRWLHHPMVFMNAPIS